MNPSPRILLFDFKEHPMMQELSPLPSTRSGNERMKSNGISSNASQSTLHASFDDHNGGPFYESESPILEDADGNKNGPHRQSTCRDFGPVIPNYNSIGILLGSVAGFVVGFVLFYIRVSDEVQKLIALPGDLFLRAFLCLILPMVFCVMTVVVAETVAMGRTSILRWRTLIPYWTTSLLSTIQGLVLAIVFKPYFVHITKTSMSSTSSNAFKLTLQCTNGLFLAPTASGLLGCIATSANESHFLASNQTLGGVNDMGMELSLVDQLVAITNLIVPVNIFASMVDGSLLSIVLFSIPLGFATAYSVTDQDENRVLALIRQLRNIFLHMLHRLLALTPLAVVFLIGSAISKMESHNINEVMSELGYFCLAFMIGIVSHVGLVLPLVLFLWTKVNPYAYIKHLVPAYVFAFGCSSSMATLPVAIACIQNAKVSRSLAHITMPFGTPLNLNACGIYYPLALVFMANMSGLGVQLTLPRYCVLFFASLLGCMGTAPVPNSSLVYNLTLWKTCFPSDPLPSSFAFLVAAEFLIDRIRTMVNVNGNAIVTRILAEEIDEAFEIQAAQQL